jgi:hypothetical protein
MFRNILAAACMLAVLASAIPAGAGGSRHGYWRGGHGYSHGYRYPHYRYKSHRHYDGAALFAGGLLLGALVGHLATAPRAYYAPPPQPALGNCRVIYGTRWIEGRLAEYSGTGCYDAYGNLYAMPGSERFLGYID